METPIERRKVYEQLAERLQARISQRRLRPGDPLPTERELTRLYRVGRSSVREAFRMLESRGLIKSIGRGAFVVAEYGNPLNDSLNLLLALKETSIHELFEVRKILEVEAAGLAAARRTEADLGAMAAAIAEMAAGLDAQERYIAADLRFHLTVTASTRNKVAVHMMHAIRGALREALSSIYHIPGSPQQSVAQHREILAAIAAGNAEEARSRMWQHLARVEGDVDGTRLPAPAGRSGAGRG